LRGQRATSISRSARQHSEAERGGGGGEKKGEKKGEETGHQPFPIDFCVVGTSQGRILPMIPQYGKFTGAVPREKKKKKKERKRFPATTAEIATVEDVLGRRHPTTTIPAPVWKVRERKRRGEKRGR